MNKHFFGRLGASLFLGMAFGLSLYNYLWIRLFPPASKRNLVLLGISILVGSLGYYLLLGRWIVPQFSRLSPGRKWVLAGASLLLGIFLMLAGTQAIKASPGSNYPLLPERTVRISAPAGQLVSDPRVVLLYFKTSTGAVPFSELETRGWEQNGNQLVLIDFSDNSLRWVGRPGRSVVLIFQQSPQGGYINVEWGGFTETVNLLLDRDSKYTYPHEYPVPLLASGASVLFLLAVNFIAAAAAFLLLLWDRRSVIVSAFDAAVSPAGRAGPRSPAHAAPSRWLWIAGIMLIALLLRVPYLDRPYVYIDEFTHLQAIKQLLSGTPLAELYQRGLFIVTLPAALFVRLFGFHLWAAKLPGVLVNVLAVIPLFLLLEKVHRKAAIIACILFAISPWMIATSRNVREYAYYPFYFYWICLGMVVFLERIPPDFGWRRDWRKLIRLSDTALALVLLLPPVFAFFVDQYSTFKIVVLMYAVFAVFLAARLGLFKRSNLLILAAAGLGLAALVFLVLERSAFVSLLPGWNLYSTRFFFPNPAQQWYFERLSLIFALAFAAAIVAGILLYRRNFIPLFIAALWTASLLGFVLFFIRFIRPRYLIAVQFWFIPLVGLGFFMLWLAIRSARERRPVVMGAAILLLAALSLNVSQIRTAFSYHQPGVMPITDEYQYDFQAVEEYLQREAAPGQVLVGSFFAAYASWVGTPDMETFSLGDMYKQQAQDYIYSVIENHDSGWMVLDDRYDRGHWPRASFKWSGKTVEYIGSLDGQLTWKWYKLP